MDKVKKFSLSTYRVPLLSATLFVIIVSLTMSYLNYHLDGEWIPISEILFSSPACYFWILWFCLIFYCTNGFSKEYRSRLNMAIEAYPLVKKDDICKYVRKDMALVYSRTLLIVFAGLPLMYLSQHYDKQSGFSTIFLIISIIPLMIDLIVYAVLHIYHNP